MLELYADTSVIIYIIECCIYNIASGGIDFYFLVIVMHICGQVEILASSFRQLINNKKNPKLDRKKFIIIIERKKYLLNLIDCLQRISFEFLILVVSLASTIQLNVVGNYNNNNNNNCYFLSSSHSGVKSGSFFYVFAELYIYCFIGDKLSSHIDNLYLSIYECCWHNFPPRIHLIRPKFKV
ncbi:Protein of unknown function [Cotesia congregata]|uniref:Uncharacterized protein n=1 Tax=Cotesia congregata TaxID=51543 RepID=A0A8J2MI82_COTCN|nr:Protein of unknown function [Cotesia congregata]